MASDTHDGIGSSGCSRTIDRDYMNEQISFTKPESETAQIGVLGPEACDNLHLDLWGSSSIWDQHHLHS